MYEVTTRCQIISRVRGNRLSSVRQFARVLAAVPRAAWIFRLRGSINPYRAYLLSVVDVDELAGIKNIPVLAKQMVKRAGSDQRCAGLRVFSLLDVLLPDANSPVNYVCACAGAERLYHCARTRTFAREIPSWEYFAEACRGVRIQFWKKKDQTNKLIPTGTSVH